MTVTIKPSRVVPYNDELLSIESHDPLITWSRDFDFLSYNLYVSNANA